MTQVDECRKQLNKAQNRWHLHWKIPYADAYILAHGRYKDTLKKQGAIDKFQAELFMLAITLGVGGGLGALYGKSALSAVTLDKAIDFVCDRNMERTFELMHKVATSPSGTFLVGSMWGAASSQVSKATSGAVEKLMSDVPQKVTDAIKDPQMFQNSLEAYVRRFYDASLNICDDLDKMADTDKRDKIANSMLAAPFIAKAPTIDAVSKATASKDLELMMYMPIIMASDHARQAKGSASKSVGGMPGKHKEWDVKEPTSSDKYPVPYNKRTYTGLLSGLSKHLASGYKYDYLMIDYRSPGSAIMGAVNKLHKERVGGAFQVGGFGKDEVTRAEKLSDQIRKTYKAGF